MAGDIKLILLPIRDLLKKSNFQATPFCTSNTTVTQINIFFYFFISYVHTLYVD